MELIAYMMALVILTVAVTPAEEQEEGRECIRTESQSCPIKSSDELIVTPQ